MKIYSQFELICFKVSTLFWRCVYILPRFIFNKVCVRVRMRVQVSADACLWDSCGGQRTMSQLSPSGTWSLYILCLSQDWSSPISLDWLSANSKTLFCLCILRAGITRMEHSTQHFWRRSLDQTQKVTVNEIIMEQVSYFPRP